MRGSPFTFSNFSMGLNVLDSPYTLKTGETRDCLNMTSTPRGAVKKRLGSTVFASGSAAYFPATLEESLTDTFTRANEEPLTKDGKGNETAWKPWEGGIRAGMPFGRGKINENKWQNTGSEPVFQGAYYSVAEETSPAAFVTQFTQELPELSIVAAANKELTKGYEVEAKNEKEPAKVEIRIWKLEAVGRKQLGATVPNVSLVGSDRLGITVISGTVTAWRYNHVKASWEVLASAADSTYTKGFSGFLMKVSPSGVISLSNFATGKAAAPPAESEFLSLLACNISGTQYLVATSGKKIFSVTESGEINDISGAKSFTEGKQWSLVQAAAGNRVAKGPVYLTNGTDEPISWTGATKTTAVTKWEGKEEGEFLEPPKAKYIVYHGNRIWAGGISGDESAVRWSGFQTIAGEGQKADPTRWPKENVNWFEKDDGTPITGLATIGPYVLVFKAHKTWVIFDLNEGENRQIAENIGCIANRTIQETPIGTMFLTPDQGVFVTNGTKLQEISRNVRPLLQGNDPIAGREDRAAKLNELPNASAGYLNNHYYLTYVAKDGSTKTLDYDLQLKSWWLGDLGGNQWVAWEPVLGEARLYTIPKGTKKGIVKAFVPGVYQDSGKEYKGRTFTVKQHNAEEISVTLTCFWASSWEPFWQYFMRHRFQQPQIKKRIRTLFADGAGQLECYAYRGFETVPQRARGVVDKEDASVGTYEPKLGTATQEYQAVRFYSLGTSRVWSFMFGNNNAENMELDTYAADLYFRKN